MTVPVTVAVPSPPPDIKWRAERLSSGLQPGVRAWIDQQARGEVSSAHFDEGVLRQAVARRFSGQVQNPLGLQADALVFLVLKDAAALMERDLRRAMEELRDSTEEKLVLRQALDDYLDTRRLVRDRPERAHLRVVPPVSEEHLAALEHRAEKASANLQTMMDRHGKFIATLYTLLSRVTATPDSLVRELS